jgi:hypothetical protein
MPTEEVLQQKQDEIDNLKSVYEQERAAREVLRRINNLTDELVAEYRLMVVLQTKAHAEDMERLMVLITGYEKKIGHLEDNYNRGLDDLLDRNVTIAQLEEQVFDLQTARDK